MLIDKILLFDCDCETSEETLFLIEFENKEEREEVEICIYNCKRSVIDWTFDDIIKAIKNNFEVKNIMEVYSFEQMGI